MRAKPQNLLFWPYFCYQYTPNKGKCHEKSEKNFNLDTQVVFYYLIYYYNLFFMSRYERMDCIKRSMMPVRYKKIGSGETYLLLEALFFTSPEPVDKKRKKQAEEA